MDYKKKYLKYKLKYLNAKKKYGGMEDSPDESTVERHIEIFLEKPEAYKQTIIDDLKENPQLYKDYLNNIIASHLKQYDDIVTITGDIPLIHALFIKGGPYYLLDIFRENITVLFEPFMEHYLVELNQKTTIFRNENEELLIVSLFNFIFENKKNLSKEQKKQFYKGDTIKFIITFLENMYDLCRLEPLIELLEYFDMELTTEGFDNLKAEYIVGYLNYFINDDETSKEQKEYLEDKAKYWNSGTPRKPEPTQPKPNCTGKKRSRIVFPPHVLDGFE